MANKVYQGLGNNKEIKMTHGKTIYEYTCPLE